MTTSNGSIPSVKLEAGHISFDGDEARIKQDPDLSGASPAALSDDDIYEDAGDLDFNSAQQAVWLTRLPKFLWENWSKFDDDEEIQLGTIRIETPPGNTGQAPKISLLLSSDVPRNQSVPKEYNMITTNKNTANSFIFIEKDLPGYASKLRGGFKGGREAGGTGYPQMPPRPQFQDRGKQGGQVKYEKGKRWQPYYRKAVPKQTAIAGQVQTEINCLPVENKDYRPIMDEILRLGQKPKRETKFYTGNISTHGGNLLVPGTLGASGTFSTFIKTTGTQRGKQPDLKAARMPQNELLDLIYNCFKRYNYWPLKSLKAELNQPENYLKQTLEMVAQLVKAGAHANTWQLRPEAKISTYADARSYDEVKDEVAPDSGYGFGLDGASDIGEALGTDEEDENVKMEDVFPA